MKKLQVPPGFQDMAAFGLLEALLGRRSRRFFLGAEIPDGVFAYASKHPPMPLSELEKLLVVMACGGNTSWHHMIYRAQRYAPHLSNYAGAAGGRTFPSSAGFQTSKTFFTDNDGVYLLEGRDAPAAAERQEDGALDIAVLLEAHRGGEWDKVGAYMPLCFGVRGNRYYITVQAVERTDAKSTKYQALATGVLEMGGLLIDDNY